MNQLHPGARWLFRLRAYSRFGGLFFIFIYIMIVFAGSGSYFADSIILAFFSALLLAILFVLIIGEIYARMSYNRYLYEITPEYVKLEHGIIWKKYTSIPYERIQNVDIRRGIIARMFGFSTVEIETAGQSGMGAYYGRRGHRQYQSEGHLPAIEIEGAEKIREFVMKKIKHLHNESGL